MSQAFFRVTTEVRTQTEILIPEPEAVAGWEGGQLRGMAVGAALARAVEREVAAKGRTDLRPVRWTLDLFRPVFLRPCRIRVTVVRDGRRLSLFDAVLIQDDRPVARAGALYLRPGVDPQGVCWSPGTIADPPPTDRLPEPGRNRVYFSEDAGWGPDPRTHHNVGRTGIWHQPIAVVAGEEPTPFQFVAGLADVTNVIANLGSNGLEYINADATLTLTRLPEGNEAGLLCLDRLAEDGIVIGTAAVYDRKGVFGTTTVSSLANARGAADLSVIGTLARAGAAEAG
ncbi:acyl-CoA thioesterase domain-containing protein [Nocardia sp. NPDC051833]|uniref:acyl-CoA thioesterase domain-containing protein n=1 Tax=Nocardia sp. NPDC051833 TaxID=3155674 RepID=UPI0034144E45